MEKLDMYKFVGELFSDEYEKLEVKDHNEHYIKCQIWGIPFRMHWYSGNGKFRVEAYPYNIRHDIVNDGYAYWREIL